MPIAEFPGRWNRGYDGVGLYAPAHVYGDAEALKRFVDVAHRYGIGVILDVVYNHLGPDGNYLKEYSDDYFSDRYKTDWGESSNFDGPGSKEVREFFIRNACYWIAEFHLDGLRFDATQNIYDSSSLHILSEISEKARDVAGKRRIVLIGENEPQDVVCLAPVEKGGYGLDALWNDDFHHSATVAITGRREAYYMDYRGEPKEFISSIKSGFLYFVDHGDRILAENVHRGRKDFLSRLDLSERESNARIYLLHRDLLCIHQEDRVIAAQRRDRIDGAVIGPNAFIIRFFGEDRGDRLLVVNLGAQFEYKPSPEPLLAPVNDGSWKLVWSSDDPRYGGSGITNPCSKSGWRLAAESTVFFSSVNIQKRRL